MRRIDIPYYSQHQDVLEPAWRDRCCGVVCTKMVLDFVKPKNQDSIDELIEEAVLVNGYTKKHGWDHDAILKLLRNRGINAYRQEFRSVLVDAIRKRFLKNIHENNMTRRGIDKIYNSLSAGRPVIVSVEPYFDENKDSHIIVLSGFSSESGVLEGFFYNDPDAKIGVKKDKFVDLDNFKKYWRKLVIFIE